MQSAGICVFIALKDTALKRSEPNIFLHCLRIEKEIVMFLVVSTETEMIFVMLRENKSFFMVFWSQWDTT